MKAATAFLLPAAVFLFAGGAFASEPTPAQQMAATVLRQWPAGVISTIKKPGVWGYEEGVLLDGLAAEWQQTADGADLAYIRAAVDKYVTKEGAIKDYAADAHTLDDIELGRAVLLCYRVFLNPRYAKAAQFLHERLAEQPRTASGAYWHKQIYPNQVWLDGAYMAEPFRAAYAATFQQPGDFDDIAKQLLLMDAHMRDGKSGLLRHGWDESRQMKWADKQTGLSPAVWGRALGWYAMALVDTLDWIPVDHSQRPAILAVLKGTMTQVIALQDPKSGLWWQVLDKPAAKGNFPEASASAMFTYAIAKSVRRGYLSQSDELAALKGWQGIQKEFVKTAPDGTVTFTGTVKVGGLGGDPYRSGEYDYYIGEKTGDNDAKGIGAYLLAGSEIEQAGSEGLAQGKTVLVDAWFNRQTRTNALGQPEIFHYKWNDDSDSGFAFLGRAFQRYGATLATENSAPVASDLAKASVYLLASPDNPSKTPAPHYMDKASAEVIEAWVRAGGVLILLENDVKNADIEHFNTLSERFGIHFNPVVRNIVPGLDYQFGRVDIAAGTGVFTHPHVAYMKEICTIAVSGPAKGIVTDKGDILFAVAKFGKGTVFAATDPWLYNEYIDGRKPGAPFDGYDAAKDLAGWALRTAAR